jgi:hypothetical protein
MSRKLTVGRMVRYVGPGTAMVGGPGSVASREYPAVIVTAYDDDTADIFVMTHIGHMTLQGVSRSEEPSPGRWCWPKMVEG